MHSTRYNLDHGIPSLVCTWLPYPADPYVQITDVGVGQGGAPAEVGRVGVCMYSSGCSQLDKAVQVVYIV